jgi:hypothetical protein
MAKKRKKQQTSSAVQRRTAIQTQASLQNAGAATSGGAAHSGKAATGGAARTGAAERPATASAGKGEGSRTATTSSAKTSPSQTANRARSRNSRRRSVASYRGWIVAGTLAVIVVIVGAFAWIAHLQQSSSAGVEGPTDPQVLRIVSQVSPDLLAKIGTGGQSISFQTVTNRDRLTGPNGKPEIFYEGGEFCPYCAATRWPMVVALSRFGTFTKLPETLSSSNDVYPNTATFTFYGSAYSSSYIDFVPLEVADRNQQPLQTPTADQKALLNALNPSGNIPFIDIANIYILQQTYDPQVLANLSQEDIAIQMTNSSTTIAKDILGTANYLTAAICVATGNQPASVCKASFIQQIEQKLPRVALAGAQQTASGPALFDATLPSGRRRL